MSAVNLNDVSDKRPIINDDNAVARCIECKPNEKSKARNDMMVLKWELCEPTTATDDKGKPVKVQGTEITDWIVLADFGLKKLKALHKALKLPMEVDTAKLNPRDYLGKAVNCRVESETKALLDKVTKQPVMDDETGEPVIMVNYNVARYKSGNDQHTIPVENLAF